VFELLIC